MQLTLRQAASYLGVGESTVRRWIGERALPVHEANERLYLNAVELWEWAVEHGVTVSRSLLEHARARPRHGAATVRAAFAPAASFTTSTARTSATCSASSSRGFRCRPNRIARLC